MFILPIKIPIRHRRKLTLVFSAIVILIILLLMASTVLINSETNGLTYTDISSIPHHSVGIVLGCPRKLSGGRINPFFSSRISAAAALFRAGKVDYLLASGDNYSRGCVETVSMREALISEGIPEERIYCDYKGLRTLDSVVRAKEIFGQKELVIISQEFHNRRAIFIAGHRGIKAIGYNAEEVNAYDSFLTKCREFLATTRAVLDVYVFNSGPRFLGEKVPIGAQEGLRGNCAGH
jgi:SanA protein